MAEGRRDAVRGLHRDHVVGVLRDHGSASRSDLVRATGLSRPTVSAIVAELLGAGTVREVGTASSGERKGRPSKLLALTPPSGRVLAVDIGHTHVRAVVADASGHVVQERAVAFERSGGLGDVLGQARRLVDEVLRAAGVEPRGLHAATVGVPSPVDLAAGRPLASRYRGLGLPGSLGLDAWTDRVRVANDADLGAVGEAAFGSGARFGTFVYVKVSHGVGAGLILGGRLFQGRGFAGDIGHIRIVDDGEVCICGNRGCLETFTSSAALLRALQPAHDTPLGFSDLVRLADAGDRGTCALLGDAGRTIGRALSAVVTTLNPEAIVVGGALGSLGGPVVGGIEEALRRYCQPAALRDLVVTVATCGEHAEALGGVALGFGLVGH
ncbi:ROK family transcriptional regulator [Streptomyces sp. NPDC051940]|uniref:ROK family transcriptional regulator n=1 Tax=Streptomyces sp. NPDC051940 TaxID=3155675 RepID=UPI00344534AE